MGDDNNFEQLIASLGTILAETDDNLSLGGDLRLPTIINAAAISSKTGLSQAASPAVSALRAYQSATT